MPQNDPHSHHARHLPARLARVRRRDRPDGTQHPRSNPDTIAPEPQRAASAHAKPACGFNARACPIPARGQARAHTERPCASCGPSGARRHRRSHRAPRRSGIAWLREPSVALLDLAAMSEAPSYPALLARIEGEPMVPTTILPVELIRRDSA